MGQAASSNGTGGNGGALASCLDAIWMRAVTERVRQFFYYPDAALAVRTTGVVTMHFTVRRNGQIDRLAISRGRARVSARGRRGHFPPISLRQSQPAPRALLPAPARHWRPAGCAGAGAWTPAG